MSSTCISILLEPGTYVWFQMHSSSDYLYRGAVLKETKNGGRLLDLDDGTELLIDRKNVYTQGEKDALLMERPVLAGRA